MNFVSEDWETQEPEAVNKAWDTQKPEIVEKNVSVPDLLLSYTYFLNTQECSFISIGYDAISFDVRVILYKKSTCQTWTWSDWYSFYNNINIIWPHFNSTYNFSKDLSVTTSGDVKLNVTSINDEKFLLSVQGSKIIRIDHAEWDKLHSMAPFLNAVFQRYLESWAEIEAYYNKYLEKCLELNIPKLSSNDFFVPITLLFKNCNYSRLFHEIPLLSKSKLLNDFYTKLNYTSDTYTV